MRYLALKISGKAGRVAEQQPRLAAFELVGAGEVGVGVVPGRPFDQAGRREHRSQRLEGPEVALRIEGVAQRGIRLPARLLIIERASR